MSEPVMMAMAEEKPSYWQATPQLRWVPSYGPMTNAPGSWKLQQAWQSDLRTYEWRDVPHEASPHTPMKLPG